jgi:cation-transporting ATPase I
MYLGDLARLPARVALEVAQVVSGAVGGARHPRDARVATDRVSIVVAGVQRADAREFREALCAAVQALPGVVWAVVNAPLQRLVIGVAEPAPSRAQLLALVESIQAAHPMDADSGETPEPPDDERPRTRAVTALAADAAGLALATVGRVARWTPGSAELASVITVIDTQPKLRAIAERALGRAHADTVIAVANAVAQGLAQGTVGLGLDTAVRIGQLAEVRAREAAWRSRQARLLAGPALAAAEPVVVERPRPLPDGQVERYAPRSAAVAAAGAAVALAAGGGPRRAAAIAVSSLPKAAGIGRETFACQLARALAQRGAQVMDRGVLRRLDRVDTVVLDVQALITDRLVVADVVALPGVDAGQAQLRAHALFDQHTVSESVEAEGWRLGPIERLGLRGRTGARVRQRMQAAGAVAVLGLARGTRLHALVAVGQEPARSGDALVAAARRAGTDLVFAGGTPPGSPPTAARQVPGGMRLLGSVRQLQADGRVVLLVSRQAQALGNADCGIGVDTSDGVPPWGAHVLVGKNLETAALLIDAVETARTVSRRGVQLAEAGSAIGAVTTVVGPPRGAARRALLAVNGAAALSLLQGAWATAGLIRRPLSPPVSSTPWHLLSTEKVLSILDTDAEGLSTREVRRRYRPDVQVNPAPASLARAFAEELANPLTPILAGGAALSAAIGSVVDAGIVAGASTLGAVVGGIQRTVTDRAVADLLAHTAVFTTARRDGQTVRLRADQLVPGDVVLLGANDVVPADCRLLEVSGLEMDESSLTGESFPVVKDTAPVVASVVADRTSMVYEGTTVAAGRGIAVVVATGAGTEAGRSMVTAQQAAPVSGVETRLAQITRTTLPIALGSAGAVMAAGLLRGRPMRRTVGAGVGLAVASVPEGLPFLVSAAQLAAARRLSRQGALVRNARTIEALGRVDVLCFDKTGTLTQGKIRLAVVSDGETSSPVGGLDERARAVVAAGLRATPTPLPGQKLAHLTDRAVRYGAEDLAITADRYAPGWRQRTVLPFEPSRGYHATVATTDDGPLLSVKGAPEILLPRCVTWRTDRGEQPLNQRTRRGLRTELRRLTGHGYRVLAVAEGRPPHTDEVTDDDVGGLSFLGYLALTDPVRASAGTSLEELRTAGAQIVMITGDHPSTAEAIADELGILNGHQVVAGADIDRLDDEALADLVPKIAVVARSTPTHKVRVVRAFQRRGRTVAMTGDGANDAPAIRLADVGIALGRRGTPAARAAADLVVTDDRLETIIAALVEGRAMWKAVREALAILVGGNIGEIGFTVLGAALTGISPLNARQLLLVNLLTDLAPALAIALRKPDPADSQALLSEGPETSLGSALTREIALRAAATTAGATAGWLAARLTGREQRARTVALAALVGTQLGQTLLVGRRSPAVLAASIGSATVLAGIVQTPGVSQFFGCTPLGPIGWGIAVTAATSATLGAAVFPTVLRRL